MTLAKTKLLEINSCNQCFQCNFLHGFCQVTDTEFTQDVSINEGFPTWCPLKDTPMEEKCQKK